jgi:hypothetical protein
VKHGIAVDWAGANRTRSWKLKVESDKDVFASHKQEIEFIQPFAELRM